MTSASAAIERGAWPQGLVGGLASLAVAWPLMSLLRDQQWVEGAILVTVLAVVTGALLRTIGAGPTMTVLAQTVVLVLALIWRYLAETLWWNLPTMDTLRAVGDLLQDAGRVLQTYAAPAPTTEGVEFLVVSMVALTALSVDAIAVTGDSPGAGGLPLAAAFLVSVSNTGTPMRWYYFAVVAALWLSLLAMQGSQLLGSWASAGRIGTRGSSLLSGSTTSHAGVARVLGAGAVLLALVVASVVPHLPPTFLADGLGRNPDARGGSGTGQVSFTETMDLSQDLNSRSTEAVLRYRTTSQLREPLRVTASSVFLDGEWQAPDHGSPAAEGSGEFLADPASRLAPGVDHDTAEFAVLDNGMRPPHLAVPAPVVSADLGVDWRLSRETDSLLVDVAPQQYEAEYLQVSPGAPIDSELPDGTSELDPALTELDPASAQRIEELTAQVVGDAATPLEAAQLIQSHFRSGRYIYSLTLAPGVEDSDPITHFLDTRQGYCVQYATAMVMMARSQGIPARMAIGFLPGESEADGTWTVRANDAHAWPELYLEGLGWTRFEPTPGVRTLAPPVYSQAPQQTEDDPIQLPEDDPALPTDQPTVAPNEGDQQVTGGWQTVLDGWLPILLRIGAVTLILAVLMTIVPMAGRRRRLGALRRATSEQEQIEGSWQLLTIRLDDLGFTPPAERSPRQMGAHYRERLGLDHEGSQALNRVTATLERSRYADPQRRSDNAATGMRQDVEAVVDTVADGLPWNIRTQSALLPRSGVAAIKAGIGRIFRRR